MTDPFPNPPADVGTPDARAITLIEEFFAAFTAQDTERALAFMAEDVVYQNVQFPTSISRRRPGSS